MSSEDVERKMWLDNREWESLFLLWWLAKENCGSI